MTGNGEQSAQVGSAVPPTAAASLGELCAGLGPPLLEIAIAPRGLDLPIAGVSLLDPREEIAPNQAAGRLLLAVGGSPADEDLAGFVREAAVAGAVGIACRASAPWSQRILEAAETLGLALVSVPVDVAWGELYELIAAAIVVDDLESIGQSVDAGWRELNDLPGIVEALAAITGGSVTIEDLHSRVIAFSDAEQSDRMRKVSILNHRVPDQWRREIRDRGIYTELSRSDDVIRVEFDDLQPRRVIAIRLGRTVLGSIWLAGEDGTLSPEADAALRRAAPIAALQMMRQRLAVGVERRMRESAAAALLRGGDCAPRALAQVGLPADESLVVLVVEVLSRSASSPAAVGSRLTDLLTVHLQAYQRPAVATALDERHEAPQPGGGERVYVLTSSRGAEDRSALRRILGECLEHAAKTLGAELRGGIGHEVEPGGDLELARRSAEDCLVLGPGEQPIVAFESVHDRAMLADVDGFVEDWRGGDCAAYQALADHDEAHGSDYVETMRCLLETFGNAPEVARRMHLHVNSARYRIRRIAEITGIDLGDGEARLALELTLRARAGAGRPGAT